ncbi:hypothetical protein WJX72_007104 [[Myrmecia] bisecta]|uniref:glutamate formimidoyltransferase n=1 Tax=[Myrmecia] bisecta TaxID=41462 RepID=A0AAW1PI28_9CHLO
MRAYASSRLPLASILATRSATTAPTSSLAAAVLACNVYVSEGRTQAVIDNVEAAAKSVRGVLLANTFVDAPYNRTGLTLVSTIPSQLCLAAAAVAQTALQLIDLRKHAASHPRVGVVDHISVHPLRHALSPSQARGHRQLADIRRSLGYFRPTSSTHWMGALSMDSLAACPPDEGPSMVSQAAGIVTIGAIPWLVNYNIPVSGASLTDARQLARAISERGGGLPGVQAMALQHEHSLEVACNLQDPDVSPAEMVQAHANKLGQRLGLTVGVGYRIGKTPEELIQLASVSRDL